MATFLAGLGQPDCERRPRLPGADDDLPIERLAHSNLTIEQGPADGAQVYIEHRDWPVAALIALTETAPRLLAPPKVPATAPATPAI